MKFGGRERIPSSLCVFNLHIKNRLPILFYIFLSEVLEIIRMSFVLTLNGVLINHDEQQIIS